MRICLLADFREEGWPSMDLVGEMLARELNRRLDVDCEFVRPPLWTLPFDDERWRNPRRFLGRFLQYPLVLARLQRSAHFFHIADHSYAHLAHYLPAERTGVYCHDIDAFRPLLARGPGLGNRLRRRLASHLLSGLRRARVVFYSTEAVRRELLESRLVAPECLVYAPYGTSDEFRAVPGTHDETSRRRFGAAYLLHVGSSIARKNTGFLLRVYARLRKQNPGLELVQVGGKWSTDELALLEQERLIGSVYQLRGIPREELAALYRGAAAVLLPSRAEGFGLPVVEALACGAPVVASDLPVLREVGSSAASYCPVDDLVAWCVAVEQAMQRHSPSDVARRVERAARFSWTAHAGIIADGYYRLARAAQGRGSAW